MIKRAKDDNIEKRQQRGQLGQKGELNYTCLERGSMKARDGGKEKETEKKSS